MPLDMRPSEEIDADVSQSPTVHDILIRARALIDNPDNWVKEAEEVIRPGRPTAYCAMGAIEAACRVYPRPKNGIFRDGRVALGLIEAELPAFALGDITDFNDEPAITHADILLLFDRAIARSKSSC